MEEAVVARPVAINMLEINLTKCEFFA